MSGTTVRRLAAWLAVASLLLAVPGSASATISGGCTAGGHAPNNAGVAPTGEPPWHPRAGGVAGGPRGSAVEKTPAPTSPHPPRDADSLASGSGKGDPS